MKTKGARMLAFSIVVFVLLSPLMALDNPYSNGTSKQDNSIVEHATMQDRALPRTINSTNSDLHFFSTGNQSEPLNYSSQLSSLLVWSAEGVTDGNQLIITGGNGLVNVNTTANSSGILLGSISGISGYTQFIVAFNSQLLIGGNNPGAQFYSYHPGSGNVSSSDSLLSSGWSGQGSDLLMSMSAGDNLTLVIEEHNGTSTGISPPQVGLIVNNTFLNITAKFPHLPAVGAGYFSAYGDHSFLVLTNGFGYLYNVTDSTVKNVTSILNYGFITPLGLWSPSSITYFDGQFIIAYSSNLVIYNPLTGYAQTLLTASPNSFFSFVSIANNRIFVGETNGTFTQILISTVNWGFTSFTDLWGKITDVCYSGGNFWAMGIWGSQSVLYSVPPPVLLSVNVTPSSDTLGVDETANFTANAFFAVGSSVIENYEELTYSWALSNNFGYINNASGNDVVFLAGNFTGNETLSVNASFNGVMVKEVNAAIEIVKSPPTLISLFISPPSDTMAVDSMAEFNATPEFYGTFSPNGTVIQWLLSNGLGRLNASTGSNVSFFAFGSIGNVTLSAKATLNGITVYSTPIKIVIVARGIWYQQLTSIFPESSRIFYPDSQNGQTGIDFEVLGGNATFNLSQGNTLITSINVTGGPINYGVTGNTTSYSYVNFIGNGESLRLTVNSLSNSIILVAYSEFAGFISKWTASMITDPPQWGISFVSADSPPYNTGMSFTIIAPGDNTIWMASSINEGYGSIWSSQVGFDRINGVSYAGWGVDFGGISHGGIDPNIALIPGHAYNFTIELMSGTTWGYFVNGIPINDTGIGYEWNMTTTTAQPGVVGIETQSFNAPTLNLTSPVIIPVASSFRYNGKWYISHDEYLSSGVSEDWYNGNFSEVPTLDLWNIAGHLENSSIPNGTIIIGQSQSPIYAPPPLGTEPIFGNFKITPVNQGQGLLQAYWNDNKVRLVPLDPCEITGLYFLDSTGKVIGIFNMKITSLVDTSVPSGTKEIVLFVSLSDGTDNREMVLLPSAYTIRFAESGLPLWTKWSITFNGTNVTSTNSVINFQEPNGTYAYHILGISGYRASMYYGTLTVNGNSVSESVIWAAVLYEIAFSVNGIPNGSTWSVELTGSAFNGIDVNETLSSTNNTISFYEPNGSYSYVAQLPSGYTSTNLSRTFEVAGGVIHLSILAKSIISSNSSNLEYAILIVVVTTAIAGTVLFVERKKQ
ncbi:MAG: hypothetical protein M1341_06220 [Candidatus Thermoplasmatota archaeon]|nr:hypothetical protein [Candidatus Thermoplasmatota archaeon]